MPTPTTRRPTTRSAQAHHGKLELELGSVVVVVMVVVLVVDVVGGATVVISLCMVVVGEVREVVEINIPDVQGIGHCQPGPSLPWVTFLCKTYWKSLKEEALVNFG